MALGGVVVPGGGKNELWHPLNCKGRYAGDLRIELTYYDTRPKQERFAEKQELSSVVESDELGRDAVGGPRQPKPVKRRPLPANPTSTNASPLRPLLPDHAQSSPLPYTPPLLKDDSNSPGPGSVHGSVGYGNEPVSIHPSRPSALNSRAPMAAYDGYSQNSYPRHSDGYSAPDYVDSRQLEQSQYYHENDYQPSNELEPQETLQSWSYSSNQSIDPAVCDETGIHMANVPREDSYPPFDLPSLPPYESNNVRNSTLRRSGEDLYESSYANPLSQHQRTHDESRESAPHARSPNFPGASPTKNNTYQESPLRHYSSAQSYNVNPVAQPEYLAEEPPPPPPLHRSSGVQTVQDERNRPETHHSISAPAPLNVRQSRSNATTSALFQRYSASNAGDDLPLPLPPDADSASKSAPSFSQGSNSFIERRQSYDHAQYPQSNQHAYPTPPSLIAGYDPSIAEEGFERISQERRLSALQSQDPVAMQSCDEPAPFDMQPRTAPLPQPGSQLGNSNSPYHLNQVRAPREHRASAPIIKPRAISPDPRTPMRKSVSPQPELALGEKRASVVPFSPDSYDSLNPNLNSASSINRQGPKYNTPEQAKEAYKEKEKENKLDEGPIIGSDGRVIDPSDHLPTETWAPEPEKKLPRKGPEITFRFRQSPQGAQPMPEAARRPPRETIIRPHVVTTPIHRGPSESISPTSATRNRLQKRSRASPGQPASSPTMSTPSNNNGHNHTPRSPSDYPLREHVNHGYGSSPTYPRSLPTAGPPVPAKVPLPRAQESWVPGDDLGEEIRRIDIGTRSRRRG